MERNENVKTNVDKRIINLAAEVAESSDRSVPKLLLNVKGCSLTFVLMYKGTCRVLGDIQGVYH